MKPIFNTLVGLLLLLASATVNGQVLDITFSPAQPGGTVGSVVTVDVIANKFEGIAGMQFPILYDKNKLQFKTCKNLTPDLPGFIFNQASGTPPLCPGGGQPPCATSIDNPAAGKLALVWFDPSGSGNTLFDNTVLFQIEFTVLQAGTSDIFIASAPPPAISVFGQGNVPATFTYPTGNAPLIGFALIVPRDSVRPGERVCMPVQVNDFNNVVGMQFMVNWNSTVFSFSHIQNYGLSGLNADNFNSTASGRCSVTWTEPNNNGLTLPNGTSIFEVCLTANGPNATSGTTSNVACNGVGMPPSSPIAIETTTGANLWSEPNSSIPGSILISSTAALDQEIVCFKVDTLLVPQVGDSAAVTIRVDRFRNLNHFQFVLSYDQNILGTGLPSLSSLALPNGNIGNEKQWKVQLIAGQPGKLRVDWRTTSAVNGNTLTDNTVLCVLKFPTNTASPGAFTTVNIGALTAVTPNVTFNAQEKPNTFEAIPNHRNPKAPYVPCGVNGSVRLGAISAPQATLVSQTNVNCFGQNIGAIDINVTGGTTTAYVYQWSNNATTQDVSGLAPGTYTVTVTSGTATTTYSTTITGPTTPISVTNPSIQNVKCFGGNDGAITINVTGGTGPYTYNWGGGITTPNRTNLSAGTYAVTITDSKLCTFVPSPAYTVSAPSAPMTASVADVKNVRCLNDVNGGATINTQNFTGALSYAWRLNGNNFIATPANAPTNLAAGTYNVTVTDANQCTSTVSNIVVGAPNSQLSADAATITAPACAGQNNGSICFAPFGGWGNYSYQWSNPTPGTGGACPTGVAPGSYNLTITDMGGCAIARSATVGAGNDIAVTNTVAVDEVCFSQSNGSISLTLNNAFTSVNWTRNGQPAGSGTSISNLAPGTYVPVVAFGNGCTKTFPGITINAATAITATLESMTMENTGSDGALDIKAEGGTAPLTYLWSNGATTQDISGLQAGAYTVTVKDAKNCTIIQTFEVDLACAVCNATIVPTQKSCVSDGCLKVTVPQNATGPFVLSWTSNIVPAPQTQAFGVDDYEMEVCDLPAGLYNVTVTDASSQSFTLPTTSIAQRPQVVVSSTLENPTLDNKNGSITLTSGPGLALSYEWISGNIPVPPNSLTSPVIFQLDSGVYCVRITNLLPEGCSEVQCFELNRLYPNLAPCGNAPTVVNPTCLTSNNGSVEIFPQGGDNTYTYQWSNGGTTRKISNLPGGTYTVTVTSGDGQTGVCGPYTIAPQSNLAITNVNELSSYNGFQVSGATVCNGAAAVVVGGTTGTVTYLWSNGETAANNTTLCGGTYTVVATDQLGCTSSWSGELTAPQALVPAATLVSNFNGYSVSCFESCNGTARVSVNGGVPPYVVNWPSGKTDVLVSSVGFSLDNNLCAGEIDVTVTDANGITAVQTLTLTEPEEIQILFTDTAPLTLANCNGEIIPAVSNGVGNLTYNWFSQFHQGTTQRADGLCAEEVVTFEVTDENGCKVVAQHTVPLPEDVCFNVKPIVTPNGDGNNDYFEIKCINEAPNTVEIYNRWNQAVVSPYTNYQNNWDGKINGVPVPEGVYFFVATFTDDQGNQRTVKGHFNILY